MVEQRGLPVAHPLRDELAVVADVALEVEAALCLVGGVRVEERKEVGPERLVFRTPSELHCVSERLAEPDVCVSNRT